MPDATSGKPINFMESQKRIYHLSKKNIVNVLDFDP